MGVTLFSLRSTIRSRPQQPPFRIEGGSFGNNLLICVGKLPGVIIESCSTFCPKSMNESVMDSGIRARCL